VLQHCHTRFPSPPLAAAATAERVRRINLRGICFRRTRKIKTSDYYWKSVRTDVGVDFYNILYYTYTRFVYYIETFSIYTLAEMHHVVERLYDPTYPNPSRGKTYIGSENIYSMLIYYYGVQSLQSVRVIGTMHRCRAL